MIFLKRRRLIGWLLKAYLKKWRKTIVISFILGLAVFFILKFGVNYFIPLIPFTSQETIGLTGVYTVDNLPQSIVKDVSKGLTTISENDLAKPGLALAWEIKNDGKTYLFHLRKGLVFSDGVPFTSDQVKYNFLDVSVERPDKFTIIFNLKNAYSPFLVTVSKPIFRNGFVGVGNYRVQSVNLNGNFVQSINLVSVKGKSHEIVYQFYPTEESLKTAFALGEIDKIMGIKDLKMENGNLASFNNAEITKTINYSDLVTLFYNTNDKLLSDKKLREALSYTIPDSFSNGQRSYGPFPPKSWVSENGLTTYNQDFDHAKLLLSESESSTKSGHLTLEMKVLRKYQGLALQIKSLWGKIGIETNVKLVDGFPSSFQVFLGEFNVSKDPDQYTLWHSSQINADNITNYKNLRIDKLLEDGRQTVDINERKKIYADFQKYLIDDAPATFLYFPFEYIVKRK